MGLPSSHVDRWHQSRLPARLGGRLLHTVPHPVGHGPLSSARLQGEAFYLEDESRGRWILKKFNPRYCPSRDYIRSIAQCLPHRPGFRSGLERAVLESQDLVDEPSCHSSPPLAAWIEDTVLMPRIFGSSCAELLEEMHDGLALSQEDRAALALDLVEQIQALEEVGAAHRDLSGGNVLVDLSAGKVHLIDWDTLYHASLPFQENTSLGSLGYMAPWLDDRPGTSWCEKADRYAMAVMVASIMAGGPGLALFGDGQLLDQDQGGPPTPPSVATLRRELETASPTLLPLLDAALAASNFESCPSPLAWVRPLEALVPGRGLLLDDLGRDEVGTFGDWALLRQGTRLWMGHLVRDVSLELNLPGLGAFAFHNALGERTVFSDGKRSALCRFRLGGRDAVTAMPHRPLRTEQEAVIHNYRFNLSAKVLSVTHCVNDSRLIAEPASPTLRYEWNGRAMHLGEEGLP